MKCARFNDFSALYRAAFAESNPDMKQQLLSDVKQALDRWAASVSEGIVPQEQTLLSDEPRAA
jgi:hypothetical protein